jgi:hypothetical protein
VGERDGAEWVVREGVGEGGEMTQALYAHMSNKTIPKKKKESPKKKVSDLRDSLLNSIRPLKNN